ncbi:hypothetical protein [Leptolyngbya sp. AN03gr2]
MQIDSNRNYRVLDSSESYSFGEFEEFPYEAEDILADLDCSLERRELDLERAEVPIDRLEFLQT